MIQWVWEAACRSRLTEQVVVATDDERIGRRGGEIRGRP